MITDFSDLLLKWFEHHGRHNLPWQQDITAYKVWVSEIMLQQTQVATVIPYFNKFIDAFPNVNSLADASEDSVLHHWTGLGYYARARNLHKAAKLIVQQFNGELPEDIEQLNSLPGIGRSTAGAIAAICFKQPAAILDGNVKRVLARCYAIAGWPGTSTTSKQLWKIAEQLTPDNRVDEYTQAIMDLGATVCTRTAPNCSACPFATKCLAHLNGCELNYPGKKPKSKMPIKSTIMYIIENDERALLLQKRPAKGLWGGLWSFPEQGDVLIEQLLNSQLIEQTRQTKLPSFRHTFTHFHLDITPIHVILTAHESWVGEREICWYSPTAPLEIGLTKPVTRLIKELTVRSHA